MAVATETIRDLEERARRLRRAALEMITAAGSGHPGGTLSEMDLLVALYFYAMRHNPRDPRWPERDRFVLSKGHGAPGLYAVLAEAGYFDRSHLRTLRQLGSILQGHPDMTRTPGLDISTGSLGLGFSAACGMAKAAKIDGASWRTYALLGDGECQEGAVWEAAMFAANYRLDNLTAIVDRNGLQQTGRTEERIELEPLDAKWRAFNWDVQVIDGHSVPEIVAALDRARTVQGRPQVIIARTVKGKGVSFIENIVGFHGKATTPNELARALRDLGFEDTPEEEVAGGR